MATVSGLSLLFTAALACSSVLACSKSGPGRASFDADAGSSTPDNTSSGDDDDPGGLSPNTPILTPPFVGDDDDAGSTSTSGADAGPPKDCSTTTTLNTCASCCSVQHPAGAKTYNKAVDSCVCGPDVCAYACQKSLCATPSVAADADCQLCANDRLKGSCGTQVSTACQADADCVLYENCLGNSGCGSKPNTP